MDFIRRIVESDLSAKKVAHIVTRFPPEPNGFLHIGHAKSIVLNFDLAEQYKGKCFLRFDDTNPEKEELEYIKAIKDDVHWLGYQWEAVTYASDYFAQLHQDACRLIAMGKAYVCELSPADMRTYRGTLTEVGRDSPYRQRSVDENTQLFAEMRDGRHAEGKMVLRAKIDMSSPNISMRDPTIYRSKKVPHPRTGKRWNIYPMYDFTHCLCDALEGITHSLCTLEFQDNRALYDWFVQTLRPTPHPQQIEFARLSLNYTITSKRKINAVITSKKVSGWDDPRLATLSGLRRRGYPANAIKNFCRRLGVAKKETVIDYSLLEEEVRNELNRTAPRLMGVIKPLKVVITNYPEKNEQITVPLHPQDAEMGSRKITFARELYIDAEDFQETASRKYFRLTKTQPVRLRYAYILSCEEVVYDEHGEIKELRCRYDASTAGGNPLADGSKVRGIIHWLAACDAVVAQVNLYERLLLTADTEELNPSSLTVKQNARIHRAFVEKPQSYQLERVGYFCLDKETTDKKPVLNQIVTLRDKHKVKN